MITQHTWTTRIISMTFFGVFLSTLFLSLFYMPVGMDMSGTMSGCPFMSHEEVLCSMGTIEHIAAWKSAFTAIAPAFALLLIAFAAVAILFTVTSQLLHRHRFRILGPPARVIRERTYTFTYRPLQEFFSNGTLHPKLF